MLVEVQYGFALFVSVLVGCKSVLLQGARICSCKVQKCVLIVLIKLDGSSVGFLCLLTKRLDVALEEE